MQMSEVYEVNVITACQWLTAGCPPGLRRFGDSCYYFSSGAQRLNFDESNKFCVDTSSHMLIINNEEEQVNANRDRTHFNFSTDRMTGKTDLEAFATLL